MKLLLDSHVLLWWLADDPRLSPAAAASIADGANDVLVSAATIWEIEIKRAKGALIAPDDILDRLADAGFRTIGISAAHALTAGRLPRHHDDPFDRVLAAQAQLEGATLVTSDGVLAAYDVAVMTAG